VPPATEMAPGHAWSVEEPATEAFSRPPWRSVLAIAGIGLLCAGIVALAVIGVVGLLKEDHDKSGSPAASPTSAVPTVAMTVAAGAQPSTVTVQAPPPTVTVPAPVTVTAQAAPPPASGNRDVFSICPDGREGVVGGRTTCAFAANVRQMFYASGMSNDTTAYSPVTGEAYEMTCVGGYTAYFDDGSTKVSTRCHGGDNAGVVIW
jgi:hypothetical protein